MSIRTLDKVFVTQLIFFANGKKLRIYIYGNGKAVKAML